ncbi:hypothetical protein [Bradyrhizobium sp. LHD-71]|uniref:hypothetical protein n=1 Tax=Bradyrhizobium sp. LHD-71 TaxID=3072141 RepID=UPI00280FA111|nr:hypothetical protein [Bradyrhizobium sp. LHD-71]MDQ8726098.1 hypothetical protein [Bradyrhizobium sp. LHD-71]
MSPTRSNSQQVPSSSLEEIAASARNGFACMFSTSAEYEAALIDERRAEGRYRKPNDWPVITFWGCVLAIACVVLLATV